MCSSKEHIENALYEVQLSKELGRYLVAARDIREREIIIREDPLISGPSDRCPKDVPVCLGCSCVMYDEPMNRCTTCHWPVCNKDCEKLESHSLNECTIFQRHRVIYPPPNGYPYINRSIIILRCLLFKEKNTEKWKQLMSMSDNGEIRRCRPNCINADKKILENFEKFFLGERFGDLKPDIIRINGIIDTNAHAFPIKTHNHRSTTVCNLYSRTSLMAHSCMPNASWSPDKTYSQLTLTIRANIPISKGSMISVAYDEGQLLLSTLKRLIPNEISGLFICKCERCLDPTELGTYLGALKCPQCEQGYLLPIDPVDSFSSWKCDNGKNSTKNKNSIKKEEKIESECCNLILDDETVVEIIEDAESMCGYTKLSLASLPSNTETVNSNCKAEDDDENETLQLLKEFVSEYEGKILHPNHYILQEVNVRILKREYKQGFGKLSYTNLIFFLERVEKLLQVADVLTPGICEYQAFLQFYFSQGLLNLERRKEEANKMENERKCGSSVATDTNPINTDNPIHDKDDKRDHNNKVFHENGGDDDDKISNDIRKQDHIDNQNQLDRLDGIEHKEIENCNSSTSSSTSKDQVSSNFRGFDITGSGFSDKDNYSSTLNNLQKIKKMLTFLLKFFSEVNPKHKLLEPISDTLEDTDMRLCELEKKKLM